MSSEILGGVRCTAPVSARAIRDLGLLRDRAVNFDPNRVSTATRETGWNVDHRRLQLPREAPGPATEDGPFVHARLVLEHYEFADQRLIRAVYREGQPLDGRDMLLVGRFLGLRFHMGVRIGGVVDEEVRIDHRPVRRFAWYYRTLEGHLERGQMDYELRKWQDTGEVELAIHAVSQRAEIGNPIVRLGWAVFGRREQLRFYDRALDRTYRLVTDRIQTEPSHPPT